MKNLLKTVSIFLMIFVWFFIMGFFLMYRTKSPFGMVAGVVLIMFGLALAGTIASVCHEKAAKKRT